VRGEGIEYVARPRGVHRARRGDLEDVSVLGPELERAGFVSHDRIAAVHDPPCGHGDAECADACVESIDELAQRMLDDRRGVDRRAWRRLGVSAAMSAR